MVKAVELKSIKFRTRTEAHEFFRAMLRRYEPGDRVSEADTVFLNELLQRHIDYPTKVGVGISHFEVMPDDYGDQCFGVVRIDGSSENFSYKRCVTQS